MDIYALLLTIYSLETCENMSLCHIDSNINQAHTTLSVGPMLGQRRLLGKLITLSVQGMEIYII